MRWILVIFWVNYAGQAANSVAQIDHKFKTKTECKVFLQTLRQDHPNFRIDGSCLPVDASEENLK